MTDNATRFKVRFARADETDRITELMGKFYAFQNMEQECEPPKKEDVRQDLVRCDEQAIERANRSNTFVIVAVDTTKSEEANPAKDYLVGYMIYVQSCFIRPYGHHLHVCSFFIEEEFRRHGLGAIFMRFLTLHGKLLGNDQIDVPCFDYNEVATNFYKKMNYYLANYDYKELFVHSV